MRQARTLLCKGLAWLKKKPSLVETAGIGGANIICIRAWRMPVKHKSNIILCALHVARDYLPRKDLSHATCSTAAVVAWRTGTPLRLYWAPGSREETMRSRWDSAYLRTNNMAAADPGESREILTCSRKTAISATAYNRRTSESTQHLYSNS
jgi:hypothetical protein